MLDKLLLNNQLLSNKKKVRQAKINIINRLVKKIRKLKQIIEKKPDDTKLKRKLDKTSDILEAVKKVQSVDLLKKALTNEKNPNSVITNGKGAPEEIAQALLFAHKSVAEVTKVLKELLHLDDERNPGWRDEVHALSKRKQKIQRIEKRAKAGHQKKIQPAKKHLDNEWVEQNPFSAGEMQKSNKPEAAGWEVVKTGDKTPEKVSKDRDFSKSSKEIKKMEDKSTQPLLEKSSSLKRPPKAVDPFFVTKSGNNYLSNVVIDRVQPEAPNDGMVRKERREQAFGYSGRAGPAKNNRNTSRDFTKSKSLMSKEPSKPEMHPSWAAKRKQKIAPMFEGKKVKFDCDGDTNVNINSENKSVVANPSKASEKLHPSWEAKQKMRKTISEFKGKKVVFDDD